MAGILHGSQFCSAYLLNNLAYTSVCLSVCHHGLATTRVIDPSCRMCREGERHNQRSTRYRTAPSRGGSVLSIPDNPDNQASLASEVEF